MLYHKYENLWGRRKRYDEVTEETGEPWAEEFAVVWIFM